MDFSTLPSLSGDDLTAALALDFSTLDNDALAAALTERKAYVATALDSKEPTVAEVDAAEAVFASCGLIETEQATRAAQAKEAGERFGALKTKFSEGSAEGGDDAGDGDAEDADAEVDDEAVEVDDEDAEGEVEAAVETEDASEDEVVTAAADHTRSQKVTPAAAAKKVAARTTRPARKAKPVVTMTAAADVQGFGAGAPLDDMGQVAKALMNRVKGFAPHNPQSAKAAFSQSGGQPVITKAGVASFGLEYPAALTASGGPTDEYAAMKEAIADHQRAVIAAMDKGQTLTAGALTAAGWCAPSPVAYNYIADYVVDGLATAPEVNAPRGGLMTTPGPFRGTQGTALDDFGWTQTEAQAEARTVKTFETIECPEFEDHRLDAIGYGIMIPLLTKKAYPELVADALKYAAALWAHRVNRRFITDIVGMSNALAFEGYGPSFTDTLEALSLIAVAERRKWSIGVNAVMEVKLPVFAQEVFRADMSRRNGVALDSVSDGQIAKHFSDRRLAVEYVSDWQETTVANGLVALPGAFTALIYPSGTFVKAVEDVVNLSAVYDAASLSVNEYLGVFFEQGYLTLKAGYGASKISIPINTAGQQGALNLQGYGDFREDSGSF